MVLMTPVITVLSKPLTSPFSALTWLELGQKYSYHWVQKYREPPSTDEITSPLRAAASVVLASSVTPSNSRSLWVKDSISSRLKTAPSGFVRKP